MSDDISKMDFKALRSKVQELEDTVIKLKRTYEDAIYNLDEENFGKSFMAEQNNMKTQIMLTAKGVKTAVSATDLDTKLKKYSTLEQTAEAVTSTVQRQADIENAVTISDLKEAVDRTKVYKMQTKNEDDKVISETYYYYSSFSGSWEKLSGDTVYTMFEQTSEGFKLKGNTIIDGNATITRNLKLSGNVTWDMENSPVLTQYSVDCTEWHSSITEKDMYMRMSFDGGNNWSTATKVVGTDGRDGTNGYNGSDAEVTPENVFNAITDSGNDEGLFPAFYNNDNHLFINASYIKSGKVTAEYIDANNLSCTRIRAREADDTNSAFLAVGVYDAYDNLSATGGFGMYMNGAKDLEYKKYSPKGTDCAFGVINASENDGSCDGVNIYSFGINWLGVNNDTQRVYPKGIWDFENCTILGFSGGSTGGTAQAVFG